MSFAWFVGISMLQFWTQWSWKASQCTGTLQYLFAFLGVKKTCHVSFFVAGSTVLQPGIANYEIRSENIGSQHSEINVNFFPARSAIMKPTSAPFGPFFAPKSFRLAVIFPANHSLVENQSKRTRTTSGNEHQSNLRAWYMIYQAIAKPKCWYIVQIYRSKLV